MNQHWDYVIAMIVGILALFFLMWLCEHFGWGDDLDGARSFNKEQEHLSKIITDQSFNEEVVDPYERISALENENHGYLVQIEKLKEEVFSLSSRN